MNDQAVFNLDGYLHCLRRLSSNKSDYWAEVLEVDGEVEESFRKHLSNIEVELLDITTVGYREIESFFEDEFRSSLYVQDEDCIKLFAWDVVEYLQTSFREIKPEIEPVQEKQAFIVGAHSKFHEKYSYLVVPVKRKLIAVGVAKRA
jgi:hypothetical protein